MSSRRKLTGAAAGESALDEAEDLVSEAIDRLRGAEIGDDECALEARQIAIGALACKLAAIGRLRTVESRDAAEVVAAMLAN